MQVKFTDKNFTKMAKTLFNVHRGHSVKKQTLNLNRKMAKFRLQQSKIKEWGKDYRAVSEGNTSYAGNLVYAQ